MKQVLELQRDLFGVAWYGTSVRDGERDYVGGFFILEKSHGEGPMFWDSVYIKDSDSVKSTIVDVSRFEGLWLRHPKQPTE